jgi:hypothetical protein
MGLLYFDKPRKKITSEEYIEKGYVGSFYPNVAKEDEDLWRAKLIQSEQGSRVEVRTSKFGCQTKIVVYAPKSFWQDVHRNGRWVKEPTNEKPEVHISNNGTMVLDLKSTEEFFAAVDEAILVLKETMTEDEFAK